MPIMNPGVYAIPPALYHADPVRGGSLSSSIARTLLTRSPAHAKWQMDNPAQSKTFDIGRAAHRVVLGAGDDFAVCPEELLASNGAMSTKAAKEWADDARSRGITPIKQAEADAIHAMAAAVQDHLSACKIFIDPAHSERGAFGKVGGIWCRALIDNAPASGKDLYDFKTTTDASPEAVQRAIIAYGYHIQAAHYVDTWKAATGEDRAFTFIFVEKEAPHACCLARMTADAIDIGRRQTAAARSIWAECQRTGQWPAYPAGIFEVDLPIWYAERWLEREQSDPRVAPSAEALRAAYDAQAPMEAAE